MLNTSKENSIKIYTYPKLDLLNNNKSSLDKLALLLLENESF